MTWFGWMPEDVVASLHISQLPTIGFKQLDNLLAVYGGYYTYHKKNINALPA
jgi:hypothetical protein